MSKASGLINELLVRLAAGSVLVVLFVTDAPASPIDLTKIVGVVAGETWPDGEVPSGTGFFIGAKGQILTAAHVVAGCHSVEIATLRTGTMAHVAALVVGVDGRIDAALLVAPSIHSDTYLRFTDDLPDVADQLVVPTRSAVDDGFHAVDVRALGVGQVSGEGNLLHVGGRLRAGFERSSGYRHARKCRRIYIWPNARQTRNWTCRASSISDKVSPLFRCVLFDELRAWHSRCN